MYTLSLHFPSLSLSTPLVPWVDLAACAASSISCTDAWTDSRGPTPYPRVSQTLIVPYGMVMVMVRARRMLSKYLRSFPCFHCIAATPGARPRLAGGCSRCFQWYSQARVGRSCEYPWRLRSSSTGAHAILNQPCYRFRSPGAAGRSCGACSLTRCHSQPGRGFYCGRP